MKTCQISKKQVPTKRAMALEFIRESIIKLIREHYPHVDEKGYVSIDELNKFKAKYAEEIFKLDDINLSDSEKRIIKSYEENDFIAKSPEEIETEEKLSISQKLADKVADFGGSWKFIISFFLFIIIWMLYNLIVSKPYDVYPFILLNLVLSCVAAIQAPIIMMSQNRKEEKDRQRSQNDYEINLKAELEIKQLHEKIDLLMLNLSHKNES
ncbi:MAG: DUF1003 domain-containing protein [Bacteroidetes bacterium]|nr:DUF1003 domain-containing protein [Bacteroidota bacterium]